VAPPTALTALTWRAVFRAGEQVPRTCVGSSCHVDCAGKTGSEQSNGTFYNNEISECTLDQVNRSDSRAFVAGTFVWSGFDYL
jgi:hypothetical protein